MLGADLLGGLDGGEVVGCENNVDRGEGSAWCGGGDLVGPLLADYGISASIVVGVGAKVVKCMTWGTTTECLNFLLRRASENKEAALRTEDTRKAMGKELWRRLRGVFGLA